MSQRGENAAAFIKLFGPKLAEMYDAHPEDYGVNPVPVETVCDRMRRALIAGTYSKEGRAMKATCKTLGIDHTYKGIEAYLMGVVPK